MERDDLALQMQEEERVIKEEDRVMDAAKKQMQNSATSAAFRGAAGTYNAPSV